MATDTRRASANPSNAHHSSSPPALLPGTAERPYHGKIYETFTAPPSLSASPASSQRAFSPPENANAIPGGSTNTAGGLVREATMWDGIKSIKADDMRSLHKIPCVRDALLVGMGLGFTIGGARMILGGTMWRAMSWAMGSFCISSAGMFEFCQQRRKLERRGMERATEIIERKKIEKEKQLEKTRAERRQRKEEVGQAREEAEKTKKRWWNSQGNG